MTILSQSPSELRGDSPDPAELLIREARRAKRLRRSQNMAMAICVVIAITVVAISQTNSQAPPKVTPSASAITFVASMKRASDTRFVATYRVANFNFFQSGVITIAQIPTPPGTKAISNSDGYASSGRYAYLYRGSTGRIAQWIKIGSDVSGCGKSDKGPETKLVCSRPSPYLPSNGFAEEDTGFVPTYVMQTMQDFTVNGLGKNLGFTTRVSTHFGRLTCLKQTLGLESQTTCIDRSGYVVSWTHHYGAYVMSVTLASFNRHPTSEDFKTLITPTRPLVLPPL